MNDEGIEELLNQVATLLVPEDLTPGDAVLFTERQEKLVAKAIELLSVPAADAKSIANVIALLGQMNSLAMPQPPSSA